MRSTRKGLRNDELHKDTYERLACAECEKTLATENKPDEVYNVRKCPDCGKEWKELP
jgi:NAD-dependent SIR2 family protein deacetylase